MIAQVWCVLVYILLRATNVNGQINGISAWPVSDFVLTSDSGQVYVSPFTEPSFSSLLQQDVNYMVAQHPGLSSYTLTLTTNTTLAGTSSGSVFFNFTTPTWTNPFENIQIYLDGDDGNNDPMGGWQMNAFSDPAMLPYNYDGNEGPLLEPLQSATNVYTFIYTGNNMFWFINSTLVGRIPYNTLGHPTNGLYTLLIYVNYDSSATCAFQSDILSSLQFGTYTGNGLLAPLTPAPFTPGNSSAVYTPPPCGAITTTTHAPVTTSAPSTPTPTPTTTAPTTGIPLVHSQFNPDPIAAPLPISTQQQYVSKNGGWPTTAGVTITRAVSSGSVYYANFTGVTSNFGVDTGVFNCTDNCYISAEIQTSVAATNTIYIQLDGPNSGGYFTVFPSIGTVQVYIGSPVVANSPSNTIPSLIGTQFTITLVARVMNFYINANLIYTYVFPVSQAPFGASFYGRIGMSDATSSLYNVQVGTISIAPILAPLPLPGLQDYLTQYAVWPSLASIGVTQAQAPGGSSIYYTNIYGGSAVYNHGYGGFVCTDNCFISAQVSINVNDTNAKGIQIQLFTPTTFGAFFFVYAAGGSLKVNAQASGVSLATGVSLGTMPLIGTQFSITFINRVFYMYVNAQLLYTSYDPPSSDAYGVNVVPAIVINDVTGNSSAYNVQAGYIHTNIPVTGQFVPSTQVWGLESTIYDSVASTVVTSINSTTIALYGTGFSYGSMRCTDSCYISYQATTNVSIQACFKATGATIGYVCFGLYWPTPGHYQSYITNGAVQYFYDLPTPNPLITITIVNRNFTVYLNGAFFTTYNIPTSLMPYGTSLQPYFQMSDSISSVYNMQTGWIIAPSPPNVVVNGLVPVAEPIGLYASYPSIPITLGASYNNFLGTYIGITGTVIYGYVVAGAYGFFWPQFVDTSNPPPVDNAYASCQVVMAATATSSVSFGFNNNGGHLIAYFQIAPNGRSVTTFKTGATAGTGITYNFLNTNAVFTIAMINWVFFYYVDSVLVDTYDISSANYAVANLFVQIADAGTKVFNIQEGTLNAASSIQTPAFQTDPNSVFGQTTESNIITPLNGGQGFFWSNQSYSTSNVTTITFEIPFSEELPCQQSQPGCAYPYSNSFIGFTTVPFPGGQTTAWNYPAGPDGVSLYFFNFRFQIIAHGFLQPEDIFSSYYGVNGAVGPLIVTMTYYPTGVITIIVSAGSTVPQYTFVPPFGVFPYPIYNFTTSGFQSSDHFQIAGTLTGPIFNVSVTTSNNNLSKTSIGMSPNGDLPNSNIQGNPNAQIFAAGVTAFPAPGVYDPTEARLTANNASMPDNILQLGFEVNWQTNDMLQICFQQPMIITDILIEMVPNANVDFVNPAISPNGWIYPTTFMLYASQNFTSSSLTPGLYYAANDAYSFQSVSASPFNGPTITQEAAALTAQVGYNRVYGAIVDMPLTTSFRATALRMFTTNCTTFNGSPSNVGAFAIRSNICWLKVDFMGYPAYEVDAYTKFTGVSTSSLVPDAQMQASSCIYCPYGYFRPEDGRLNRSSSGAYNNAFIGNSNDFLQIVFNQTNYVTKVAYQPYFISGVATIVSAFKISYATDFTSADLANANTNGKITQVPQSRFTYVSDANGIPIVFNDGRNAEPGYNLLHAYNGGSTLEANSEANTLVMGLPAGIYASAIRVHIVLCSWSCSLRVDFYGAPVPTSVSLPTQAPPATVAPTVTPDPVPIVFTASVASLTPYGVFVAIPGYVLPAATPSIYITARLTDFQSIISIVCNIPVADITVNMTNPSAHNVTIQVWLQPLDGGTTWTPDYLQNALAINIVTLQSVLKINNFIMNTQSPFIVSALSAPYNVVPTVVPTSVGWLGVPWQSQTENNPYGVFAVLPGYVVLPANAQGFIVNHPHDAALVIAIVMGVPAANVIVNFTNPSYNNVTMYLWLEPLVNPQVYTTQYLANSFAANIATIQTGLANDLHFYFYTNQPVSLQVLTTGGPTTPAPTTPVPSTAPSTATPTTVTPTTATPTTLTPPIVVSIPYNISDFPAVSVTIYGTVTSDAGIFASTAASNTLIVIAVTLDIMPTQIANLTLTNTSSHAIVMQFTLLASSASSASQIAVSLASSITVFAHTLANIVQFTVDPTQTVTFTYAVPPPTTAAPTTVTPTTAAQTTTKAANATIIQVTNSNDTLSSIDSITALVLLACVGAALILISIFIGILIKHAQSVRDGFERIADGAKTAVQSAADTVNDL